MKKTWLLSVALVAALVALSASAFALEPFAAKESNGPVGAPPACPLAANVNGTCANLKYYNLCSGYIWIFSGIPTGDAFGTRFDGTCVSCAGHRVKRGITYYRGTVPAYNQTVDVSLNVDANNDGCPEGVIASDLNLDPGERWNCSNFGACITVPAGQSVIIRSTKRGASAPNWSTDGPYTSVCDPTGQARSYYYPLGGGCLPWIVNSPTGRNDNFLSTLVVDNDAACTCVGNATENTSWGNVKGLYH